MQIQLTEVAGSLVSLVAGGLIGFSFGLIQEAARRRHERLEQEGKLSSGWAVMPGSMRRVGYLLLALALVQLVCPLLFTPGRQWWVSGGVVAGYAIVLFRQLRQRMGVGSASSREEKTSPTDEDLSRHSSIASTTNAFDRARPLALHP